MEDLWYLGAVRCRAPYPPPPSLSVKFMELEWSWRLGRWCMKYHGISFALQQQSYHKIGMVLLVLLCVFVCVCFRNRSSGHFFSQIRRKEPERKQSY